MANDILVPLIAEGLTVDCGKNDGYPFLYVDPDFLDFNQPEKSAETVEVAVYEMQRTATFEEIFKSVSPDLNKLCLTRAQIVTFLQKYGDKFKEPGKVFMFLLKSGKEFKVIVAAPNITGLFDLLVWGIEVPSAVSGDHRHRVVVRVS